MFDARLLSETEKADWRMKILESLRTPRAGNIFLLRYALQLGVTVEELYRLTKIDRWFLQNIKQIVNFEEELYEYTICG